MVAHLEMLPASIRVAYGQIMLASDGGVQQRSSSDERQLRLGEVCFLACMICVYLFLTGCHESNHQSLL